MQTNTKKPKNIPEIVTDTANCKVGSEVDFSVDRIKEIVDEITLELQKEKIKLNKIDVRDKIAIYINVEDRFEVFLGTSNNIKEKIRHLSGMLKKIPKSKKGDINLSMWTSIKPEGTFIAKTKPSNSQKN